MKKILVITSKYLPNPSANGINTKYIVDELIKRNYHVTIVGAKGENESDYEVINETPIYRVIPSFYTRILKKENETSNSAEKIIYKFVHILRKIKLVFLLPFFPNFDNIQTKKIYTQVEKLIKKEKFDCVIGVFKPYSNIAALKRLKKQHPDIVCGAYYLDLLNSMKRPKVMPRKMYNNLIKKETVKSTELLDFSMVAVGGKKQIEDYGLGKLNNKIHYIDFPTFLPNHKGADIEQKMTGGDEILLTYAGTLNTEYRNPEMLIKTLYKASAETHKITLNIYGTNDCKAIFEKYSGSKNFVINNLGLAPHEEVIAAMQSSDFLINVSNKIQDAVPSKIFEMFSMGKPIIDLVFDSKDITTKYFDKYPYVFAINSWEDEDGQAKDIIEFLTKSKGLEANIEKIKEQYIENTPGYTADIIESYLK